MPLTSPRLRASATGAAALATAVVASLVPGAAQASRTVAESYPVPTNGTIVVTGHGYGHGHGMSQYGAWGAAKKGLTAQQILAFYYPGTTPATASGTIRVLVTADTSNAVSVLPASGLRVREVGSGTTYALPATAGIRTWRLRTVAGRSVLDYDNGAWRTHRTLSGDAEFYGPASVALRVGGSTRAYRGALRLSSSNTVNVLGLDDYVRGVVAREMPASWASAALQAQAVAARTYAARDRADNLNRYYQTCDTTACQVYGGVAAEDSRSNAAVAATAGQVLNHGGRPAFTQFGSSSGGWLSAGSTPYLVAKADPYDAHSGNPVHTWTRSLTRAEIQRAYPSLGTLQRIRITRRDGNGEWYGRVEQIVLDGSRADVTLTGNDFRSRFGLRSQWFRPAGGSSAAPAPAPAAQAPASAITRHWRAIGGTRSTVGRPTSREYAVASGRARRYQHGRIYFKTGAGAHHLYGRVLKAYVKRGAASARLGFPIARQARFARGAYGRFEGGVIRVYRSGRVTVTHHR